MSEPTDELDGLRIRQIAAARRAAYRARSYCVIGTAGCAVAAIQLAWMAVTVTRQSGLTRMAIAYAMFAIVAFCIATYFGRRAAAFHREAKASQSSSPLPPPDFTSLSDGSSRWKNLEDIR
jgi:hypothetical protein